MVQGGVDIGLLVAVVGALGGCLGALYSFRSYRMSQLGSLPPRAKRAIEYRRLSEPEQALVDYHWLLARRRRFVCGSLLRLLVPATLVALGSSGQNRAWWAAAVFCVVFLAAMEVRGIVVLNRSVRGVRERCDP
ncbi:hypothetical protein FHX37_0062 [Haloactinospora alba]|uniref:Uncharacterized protein n=1 Tax=Haloactinospora alba TaxID=405555 RepID=A0A543NED1_9ACTN|nr:hypothetical protein [Haloactinospora alba]TQN30201.1 hypothetical protein FHX37_0062 [Haloactinospora alba]